MDVETKFTHDMTAKIFQSLRLRNQGNLDGSLFVLREVGEMLDTLIHHTEALMRDPAQDL